jgi:hypothetical protein
MKLNELIDHLKELQSEYGDVEVLITDGYKAECYSGDYEISPWKNDDGTMAVDIGIGGCQE